MTDEPITNNGWTKLYHPTGALVTIPLRTTEPITVDQARIFITSVDNLVTAGFSPNMPGLEEGELMEEISAVARREGSDQTPIIDFYSSNTRLEKKYLHTYLNTPEDIDAFQQATGILLDTLTTYDGQQAIERSNRNAAKYIQKLAAPIKVVYKISPKWEQWNAGDKSGQEPHKRLLVRYETGTVRKKASGPEPQPERKDEPGVKLYRKTAGGMVDGELITLIVKKMNVKPSVIAPILAKVDEPISLENAIKLVEEKLIDAQP